MNFSTLRPRTKAARDLNAGLPRRLRTDEQLNTYVATVEIGAGEEAVITNHLRDVGGRRIVPGEWQVIDAAGAPIGAVVRGTTAWTDSHLTLRNTATTPGQFRVRFVERPQVQGDSSTQQLVAPEAGSFYGVSELRYSGGNGHGSTDTKIRRFTTQKLTRGSGITVADSAANGTVFTLTEDAKVFITYGDKYSAGSAELGISVNCAALTTAIGSLSYDQGQRGIQNTADANFPMQVSFAGALSAGDVIRAHTDGQMDDTGSHVYFFITAIKA